MFCDTVLLCVITKFFLPARVPRRGRSKRWRDEVSLSCHAPLYSPWYSLNSDTSFLCKMKPPTFSSNQTATTTPAVESDVFSTNSVIHGLNRCLEWVRCPSMYQEYHCYLKVTKAKIYHSVFRYDPTSSRLYRELDIYFIGIINWLMEVRIIGACFYLGREWRNGSCQH